MCIRICIVYNIYIYIYIYICAERESMMHKLIG